MILYMNFIKFAEAGRDFFYDYTREYILSLS